jgi:hypothetical protein
LVKSPFCGRESLGDHVIGYAQNGLGVAFGRLFGFFACVHQALHELLVGKALPDSAAFGKGWRRDIVFGGRTLLSAPAP